MSEALLGTESFIDKVIRTDASLAEKILGKIGDLKAAFERIGDPEAQAQHKRLADRFEADGSLKNTLDGDNNLEYNNNYVSYTARNSVQKIVNTLSDMSADVAEKYAKVNNVDVDTAKSQVGEEPKRNVREAWKCRGKC